MRYTPPLFLSMRLALIADIHANLVSFEAVVAQLKQHAPDHIIILGDVVNCGPDSGACWRYAQRIGCRILRGNHER
jgi:predicted phosphodiesterase